MIGGASGASGRIARELSRGGLLEGPAELAGAERAVELEPALLRLGFGAPCEVSASSTSPSMPPPPLRSLREIERIGAHLGVLESSVTSLEAPLRDELAARLARARVLAEVAGALADLRERARAEARVEQRA